MSTLFKSPPDAFIRHSDRMFPEANIGNRARAQEIEHDRAAAANNASSAPLRGDHLVLLAIDISLTLHASLKKWRQRRKTLRVLADLDERQLRDVGLTRDGAPPDDAFRLLRGCDSYRALAGRDDAGASVEGNHSTGEAK